MKKGYRKRVKHNDPPGLAVTIENNNVESALKRFKRKVKDSGLMLEIQQREYYHKPSEIRREKKALGRLRSERNRLDSEKDHGIYF